MQLFNTQENATIITFTSNKHVVETVDLDDSGNTTAIIYDANEEDEVLAILTYAIAHERLYIVNIQKISILNKQQITEIMEQVLDCVIHADY